MIVCARKISFYFNLFLDVDECQSSHGCSSSTPICTNTEGSYTCTCLQGYQRGDNDTICVGEH